MLVEPSLIATCKVGKNNFMNVLQQYGGRVLLKGAIVIGLLILFGFAIKTYNFDALFKSLPFARQEEGLLNSEFGYVLFAGLLVSIGCPRQIVSFFAAYFFGLWSGIVLGLAGTILGCVISFSIARLFQGYFKDLVKGKLGLALEFWRDNTFFATLIWRFLPAGSNLLTNLAAGALGISALHFLLGSAFGYIPQTVVFAVLGAGVDVGSNFQVVVSIVLFVISVLLGLMLFAKYKKQLSN